MDYSIELKSYCNQEIKGSIVREINISRRPALKRSIESEHQNDTGCSETAFQTLPSCSRFCQGTFIGLKPNLQCYSCLRIYHTVCNGFNKNAVMFAFMCQCCKMTKPTGIIYDPQCAEIDPSILSPIILLDEGVTQPSEI